MTRIRTLANFTISTAFFALALWPLAASAQDRPGGFLDNLFNRGEQTQAPRDNESFENSRQPAPADNTDVAVRLDRVENALRQLTGTIEQLQYRNQQLEERLKRMQEDADYRSQQSGARTGAAPGAISAPARPQTPPVPGSGVGAGPRTDVFDPAQNPNAPGVPRVLGNSSAPLGPQGQNPGGNGVPVGAPGGRAAGAPLDLTTLSRNAGSLSGGQVPVAGEQSSPLPPPQGANPSRSAQLATLPPSARPQDEYDLAYGYVLHKDYALAEQAFRDFLAKYPSERLVPDAQYWLGESLFQQQHYREAAESFLSISTKYEHSGKAPDSLLRLGQSLAALKKKEAACATFVEVNRKYPRASAGVKRGVAQELKRVHC